jgi:hypothetical protein
VLVAHFDHESFGWKIIIMVLLILTLSFNFSMFSDQNKRHPVAEHHNAPHMCAAPLGRPQVQLICVCLIWVRESRHGEEARAEARAGARIMSRRAGLFETYACARVCANVRLCLPTTTVARYTSRLICPLLSQPTTAWEALPLFQRKKRAPLSHAVSAWGCRVQES